MCIQERGFLLGLCLLGGVAFSLAIANTRNTTTPGASNEDTQRVQPLRTEWHDTSIESRSATKEADIKAITEAKKKPVIDFKVKGDQKYQKPVVKDDDSKKAEDSDASTTSSIAPMMTPIKVDQSTTSMDAMSVTVPFLLHGEPIVPRKTIQASDLDIQDRINITADVHMTEETTSSRGRALNISAPEPTNSLHANITDLSDISMDEDDKEVEGGEYVASHNETAINISSALLPKEQMCIHKNRTYTAGEKIIRDCEEKCVCSESGITDCQPLCVSPYIKAGREIENPLCQEKKITEEPCCALVICATDSATEPDETCIVGNKTIARGERVEDGCSKVCICEAGGRLKCQPRCPPNDTTSIVNQHDRCVALSDPKDPCCIITLCDVTLGDHEIRPENSTDLNVQLMDVKVVNSTAIKLKLSAKNPLDVTIEISQNNHVWRQQKPDRDGVISNLESARMYYVRVIEGSRTGPATQVFLPAEVIKTNISEKIFDKNFCNYRGQTYKVGANWYDDCVNFCTCKEGGKHECSTIQCPTDHGLDSLDPHCIDWETVPPDFVPKAPHCCPQEVRCRNNGSCNYQGVVYKNWSELPTSVTGCDKICYCEMGQVSCRPACNPVTAYPPENLPCSADRAILAETSLNPCCSQWTCNPSPPPSRLDHNVVPGSFPVHGGITRFQPPPSFGEVVMQVLEALDAHTIRLVFTVPKFVVGLPGRVELRYTDNITNFNVSTWNVQTFAPPNDLIATEQLESELSDLKPSTEYKVKITVKVHNMANNSTSKIYRVRTLEVTTLPPQIPIDAELRIAETNSTWVNVMWKSFSEEELKFIDGVQLRYKERDSVVYAATPLIHRAVTNYVIENLKPSTTYEIGIYFIPFSASSTELISEKTIQVSTYMEPDPYSFDVKIDVKMTKSTDVEVSWSGVPYPEDKYVNIYRAIYQSDTGKEDTSTFKIAKRDSHAKTVIGDLKPGTRYRVWLEMYLTNGKIKKSNVQDFITKPGVLLPATVSQQAGKFASLPLHEGDYYGPLVIVAIVASLAILSTLILLMMLMKRRTSSKADISPRKATSAYDNPSYKVELQQETMDL